jgi:hypothetical protein
MRSAEPSLTTQKAPKKAGFAMADPPRARAPVQWIMQFPDFGAGIQENPRHVFYLSNTAKKNKVSR